MYKYYNTSTIVNKCDDINMYKYYNANTIVSKYDNMNMYKHYDRIKQYENNLFVEV